MEEHHKTKRLCAEFYDTKSGEYDEKRFTCSCQELFDLLSKETVYSCLRDCRFVLDAGTGTGRFAIYLAEKGINVIAIDSSLKMLTIARKKAKERGIENKVQFIQGDVESIPLIDGALDGICCIHVLTHLPSQERVISEFSRTMQQRGIVVLDLPRIFKAYRRIHRRFLNVTTFSDYPYDLKYIKKVFLMNCFRLAGKKRYGILPMLLVHLLMCKLNLRPITYLVKKIMGIRFGWHTMVKGVKI